MRVFLLILLLIVSAWADPLADGNAFLQKNQYAEALAQYEQGLKESPDSPELLFQAGVAAFNLEKSSLAIERWKRLSELEPTNWRVLARLVTAYQQAGQLGARDAQRQALYDLWSQNKTVRKEVDYCRDQFQVGDRTVLAFEKFTLHGTRPIKYLFVVSRNGKREPYTVALGSYDNANQAAHQAGEIPPDGRLYHLDYHGPNQQIATYVRYPQEPDYDELKKSLIGILQGTLKPLSTSEGR